MEVTNSNPFLGLIPDLMIEIFFHLPINQVAGKVTLVCKTWLELTKTEQFWKTITIHHFGKKRSENQFKKQTVKGQNDKGQNDWKAVYIYLTKLSKQKCICKDDSVIGHHIF